MNQTNKNINICKIFSQKSNQDLEKILGERDPNNDINKLFDNLNVVEQYENTKKIFKVDISFLEKFKDHFILKSNISQCLCNIVSDENNKCGNNNFCLKKTLSKGAVGEAYLVDIFGKPYVMKGIPSINFIQPKLSYIPIKSIKNNHVDYNKSIDYNKKNMIKDGKKVFTGLLTLGLDSFSNQTCIHMILNHIFDKKIKNYVYQYDAFYCKTSNKFTGYNIMNIANSGDLTDVIRNPENKFSYQMILNIFEQLLVPLSVLKCNKFGFIHGDFKCNNIFVNKENNVLSYLLADFDKSSIFWKGIRFYNQDAGALCTLPVKAYNGMSVSISKNSEPYYKFNTVALGFDIQCYSMNSPIPMFTSYDFYTFIVSLLREPTIFEIIYQNPKNYDDFKKKVLNVLFFDDDLINFEQNIKDNYHYYVKNYLAEIYYKLETNPTYKKPEYYNLLFNSKTYEIFQKKLIELSGAINDIEKIPEKDVNLLGNQETKNLINIIIKYKTDLNKKNKGIGNINKTLNPLKLKINIDKLYTNFNIRFPTEIINKQLCEKHVPDEGIYQVSDNDNICLNMCVQNTCTVFTGKKDTSEKTKCKEYIKK